MRPPPVRVAARSEENVTITRILVPSDFSDASDAALAYARAIARRFSASIHLLYVFDDPFASGAFVADGVGLMPVDLRESLFTDARARLADRLTAHAQLIPGSSSALVVGPVARRIVEYADENEMDLIVMGTHGRGGLAHALLGSVAERVVRTAHCPVLTTRSQAVPIEVPVPVPATAPASA
jgi:universal stress protein A